MSKDSPIEWTTHTFNPWIGCAKVSAGCLNCYAERYARRLKISWGHEAPRHLTSPSTWTQPRQWNVRAARDLARWLALRDAGKTLDPAPERPRVFPSLMDWLDPEVKPDWLAQFLHVIYSTPALDWLLLTKRPELLAQRLAAAYSATAPAPDHKRTRDNQDAFAFFLRLWMDGMFPPNVWLGVSAENQPAWNSRWPILQRTAAAVRFVSLEPLLDSITLTHLAPVPPSWLILGGETGPRARPCSVANLIFAVNQARTHSIPVFVKQLGARSIVEPGADPHRWPDRRGVDPALWPAALRHRRYPQPRKPFDPTAPCST